MGFLRLLIFGIKIVRVKHIVLTLLEDFFRNINYLNVISTHAYAFILFSLNLDFSLKQTPIVRYGLFTL